MNRCIFLFALACATSCFGQNMPQPGDYIQRPALTKFVGTWEWISGPDTVTIFLKKEKILSGNFYVDQIVGYHKYKIGGFLAETSYEFRNQPFSSAKSTILGSPTQEGLQLLCGLSDLTKGKPIRLTLTINQNQDRLTWHSFIDGVRINEVEGITLPRDMVLIKQ